MSRVDTEELVQRAATSEQYFTSLSTETRIEMISILVVDRIMEDIDGGGFLLRELKETEGDSRG